MNVHVRLCIFGYCLYYRFEKKLVKLLEIKVCTNTKNRYLYSFIKGR